MFSMNDVTDLLNIFHIRFEKIAYDFDVPTENQRKLNCKKVSALFAKSLYINAPAAYPTLIISHDNTLMAGRFQGVIHNVRESTSKVKNRISFHDKP